MTAAQRIEALREEWIDSRGALCALAGLVVRAREIYNGTDADEWKMWGVIKDLALLDWPKEPSGS